MKKTIQGKVYDTNNAKQIFKISLHNEWIGIMPSRMDLKDEMYLYQKPKGEYFIFRDRGGRNKFIRPISDEDGNVIKRFKMLENLETCYSRIPNAK